MTPAKPIDPLAHQTASTLPTSARHWVIVFAVTLAIITYIDRVCISQAAPDIMNELKLTDVQMGYAFGAFFLAYGIFEIPGGWLGDCIGPRKVLTRVVILWSFFTAATGWVWNLLSLLVARFWFGAGEAGCFPNLTKVFTTWLPTDERTRAQGIMWMSARWGGEPGSAWPSVENSWGPAAPRGSSEARSAPPGSCTGRCAIGAPTG